VFIAKLNQGRPTYSNAAREFGERPRARALRVDKGIKTKIDGHPGSLRRNNPAQVRWVGRSVSTGARRAPMRCWRYLIPLRRRRKHALPAADDFAGLVAHWRQEARMVPFFVQIKCQLGKSYEVANKLADAEIASEIYSTAGDFDLLAKFYVEDGADIGHFVNEKVQTIPGIQNTHTIITFKAFGR
jgi:DNA-binding Lrp family transcriptional regulator